jgi:hypothetical protein
MSGRWFIPLLSLIVLVACNPNRKLTRMIPPAIITDSAKTAAVPLKDDSQTDAFMMHLLQRYPEYFDSLITNRDSLHLQIIYTQVDRNKNGAVKFTDHYFNLNPGQYFYPASTVKFPIALLALQKLNELNIPGVDKNTTMITEAGYPGQTVVYNDPNSADGRPTIANYIKKIFLVSDNDAFNRLYEFLGQEYINDNLHKMGYADAQILHRLNISLTEDENRHTNPVRFIDSTGKILYEQPAAFSQIEYAERDTRLGKGYMRGNELVNEPFDFSKKNRLSLSDLHSILKSVMFPEAVAEKQRFDLTADEYAFVRKYMSMFPRESTFPQYILKGENCKFFVCDEGQKDSSLYIRVFNKPGGAYGFLTDVAYVADFKNNIEFMVSAIIYCNSDGIFNDDKYDYDEMGLPFFKHLGEVLYDYELKRERKFVPDLSAFKFTYRE